MIRSVVRLSAYALSWQAAATLGAAVIIATLVPRLLLLSRDVATETARSLLITMLLTGLVGLLRNSILLRRHRFLLRTLTLGSRAVEGYELRELAADRSRVTMGFLLPLMLGLAALATIFRPKLLDVTTALSVALLAAVFVAAAALSLQVVLGPVFLKVVELAPPDALGEVVEQTEKTGLPRQVTLRRLVLAVALPVAFVAIGSALIANAHVRRADERQREEAARALARVSLEAVPGLLARAGLSDAQERARELGFSGRVLKGTGGYSVTQGEDGVVTLSAPLDEGFAKVRFSGSTVRVLSPASLLVALLAMALALWLGVLLGRFLGEDLGAATRGLRLLGTEAVISGDARLAQPARFRDIEELSRAFEGVAERFRVFARAQERAIGARQRAARMRGLFFASVSHDLKSPLNAILGFTELVQQLEPLSEGQTESVALIERRGRELLALIETILDAARVEAKQLNLLRETVPVGDLLADAVAKGRDLGGERPVELITEIQESISPISVDRVRVARAIATLIGHALRSAEREYVRMRAAPSQTGGVRIDIEVPGTRVSATQLEAMLNPTRAPGIAEHRGLALGLSLARAVIALHDGSIAVADRAEKGSVFTVRLPAAE